jgi:prophage maintenance system killer protein
LTEAINLTAVEPQKNGLAGATLYSTDVKIEVGKYIGHLQRENKRLNTLRSYETYLDMLVKIGADLFNPDSVKDKIALQESWGENTKRMAAAVYKGFASFNGIAFRKTRAHAIAMKFANARARTLNPRFCRSAVTRTLIGARHL